jgi:hypothetical protein
MNRPTVVEKVTPRIGSTSRCGQCRTPLVWDEVYGWLRAYHNQEVAEPVPGPGVPTPIGLCCSRPPRPTTPPVVGRENPTPRGCLAVAGPGWMAAAPPIPSPSTSMPQAGVG